MAAGHRPCWRHRRRRDPRLRPEAVRYNDSAEILQLVWIAARSNLREVFESVTLESLAGRTLPPEVEAMTRDDDAWQPH